MMPNPKVILGLIVFFILFIALISLLAFSAKNQSYLLLTSEENRFKLQPFIQNSDEDNFKLFLSRLGITQELQKSVYFELDSTASAKLAFVTPVKTDISISTNSINFSGRTSVSLLPTHAEVKRIQLPKPTILAIFAPDLSEFVKQRLDIPKSLGSWFESNIRGKRGDYMAIFGQDADFVYLFYNPQMTFEPIKDIKEGEDNESIYKEDSYSEVKLHLVRLLGSQAQSLNSQTLAFFEYNDFQVMSSSISAAREFVDAQNSSNTYKFPNTPSVNEASVIVEYQNSNDAPISQKFHTFLLETGNRSGNSYLNTGQLPEKIGNMSFILKGDTFSGLINLK